MVDRSVLTHLAVEPREELAYRVILRSPGLGPEALALACGFEPGEVDAVVERLQERSMVKLDRRQRLAATDPGVVVERLIEQRLGEIHEELREVIASRNLAEVLAEDHRQGIGNAVPTGVERVEGLEEVRERIDELTFFTHHELLSVQARGAMSAGAIEATREPDLRCLRRGVEMRTVFGAGAMDDPLTAGYLRELMAKGMQVRISDSPLERVLIFDRRTALVPIDPQDSSQGALVVHQAGMLASLLALFERFWENASRPDEERLSENEQQVLRVMIKADKDEAGARELNISVRTYRSRVAELMRHLGATNRVQAALTARERGWI